MNTAEYVDKQIQALKSGGIPLSEAAWKASLLCVGWPYIFGAKGQLCTQAYRRQVYNRNPSKEEYQNVRKNCQAIRETNPTGSCAGCKWYPNKQRVRSYDCRGFTYWILLQIYGWELKGSGCTKQWNEPSNWKAKGNVEDGIPQGVIVCLFYWKKDKSGKRTTTVAHTGLYFNGQTCECSSGVQHSKTLNKKWEMWGVPACVDVVPPEPTPTPPGPEPEKKPTIRRGDRGPYVKLCQEDLMALGYSVGSSGADGIFGKNTEAGVKAFQKDHDDRDGRALKVDGIVGEKTWGALDDAIGKIGT